MSSRQYVLYIESFIKTTIVKGVESGWSITPPVIAGCDDENIQRQSITESKQANKKQKEVETFTLNLYVPEDSFIFVALAVNWLKMNRTSSLRYKNPKYRQLRRESLSL